MVAVDGVITVMQRTIQGAMMVYDLAMESPLGAVLASIAPVAGAPMLGFLRDVSNCNVHTSTAVLVYRQ